MKEVQNNLFNVPEDGQKLINIHSKKTYNND